MKKKRRTKCAAYCSNAATTTSKDWGFGPVPCKGGKSTNYEGSNWNKKESKGE